MRVIKTPCVFYFRSVKFHYVKETHDINSLLTLVKIGLASRHKKQPNKFCQDLLTIENTDSDLKVHALHYAKYPKQRNETAETKPPKPPKQAKRPLKRPKRPKRNHRNEQK